MPTLAVASRLKSGYVVLSAVDQFGSRALERLSQRPVPSGREPPVFGHTFDGVRDQLTFAIDHLFVTDTSYVHELSNDKKFLVARDASVHDFTRVVVRSKNIFDNLYQPANIEEFGFPRQLSRDAEILNQQGKHLDGRLREPDLPLPEPLAPELAISPVVIADVILPYLTALDRNVQNVRFERRGLQLASLARNQAIEAYDQTFLWVARTAESLFNLAGEKELAKRVRPSTTRPGRTETDPEVILAETGQTSGPVPDHPAFLPVVPDPADETSSVDSEPSPEG